MKKKIANKISVSPDLLGILICPVCNGSLDLKGAVLKCKKCKKEYAVKKGIPCMIPK